MKSLLITAAVVVAAIVLAGCPYHRQPAVPGPQAAAAPDLALHRSMRSHLTADEPVRPGGITGLQGGLEEAFSRRPCTGEHPQFRF